MTNFFTALRPCLLFALGSLVFPEVVHAVQTHGEPEGLYAHQVGHMAFLAAMIYIGFRIRGRQGAGWGFIRLSFIFFAVWNVNAFLVHAIQSSLSPEQFEGPPGGLAQFFFARDWVDVYFFFGKMDHLLCAPATLFLGLGLRRLGRSGADRPPNHGP
jgi:hypothetical protein